MLEKFKAYSQIVYFIKSSIKILYGIDINDKDLNLKISKGKGNLYSDITKVLYYKYKVQEDSLESVASKLSSTINLEASNIFSTEPLQSGGLIIIFKNRFYIDIIRSLNSLNYKANFGASFNYKNILIDYGIINTINDITIPDLRKYIIGNTLYLLFKEDGIFINSHISGYPHSTSSKKFSRIVDKVVEAIKKRKYENPYDLDEDIKDYCFAVRKDNKCIEFMDESIIRQRAERIIEIKMNNDYGYKSMINIMPAVFNFNSLLFRNKNIAERILKNNNIKITDELIDILSIKTCDYRTNNDFLISIIDDKDRYEHEISKMVLSKFSSKIHETIIPIKQTKIVNDYIKNEMIQEQSYRFFLHGLDEDLLIFILAYVGTKKFVIENFERMFDKDSQFYKDLKFIKEIDYKLKREVMKTNNYYYMRSYSFIREDNMDLSILNDDNARRLFNKILELEVIKYKCKERLNISYIPKYIKELAVLASSFLYRYDSSNKSQKEKNIITELLFLANSIIACMMDNLGIKVYRG